MAITNPDAIRFSNEHIRPTAERMARSFYKCQKVRNDWQALAGTDDEKWSILEPAIGELGERMQHWYGEVFASKRLYDALTMNTLFPNDAAEILDDGAPGDGRGQITGQDIRRINARSQEWLAWLEKAAFDPVSVNPVNYSNLEHFMRVTTNTTLVTSTWGRIAALTRPSELVTEYTVTNPAFLNHVLKVAVSRGN